MMKDSIFFLRVIARSFLIFLFVTTTFSNVYAKDDLSSLMSDMQMSIIEDDKRPTWDEVDTDLKNQIASEYRSPDFNEIRFFAKYVELVPPEAILDFLEIEEATCHRRAHELGRAVFRKTKDINESLKICSNSCTNACMHGAIGEAFSDDSEGEGFQTNKSSDQEHRYSITNINQLVEKMELFCDDGEMARQHKRGNCAHAMGHALMLKTEHDIATSIAGCSRFIEPGMDYYCATGVYMQYMDNAIVNKKRVSDTEQWGSNYPCNTHTAYPAACYRYIMSEVKEERGLGLEHLVMLCAQLPDETRAGCFHGLGSTYTPVLTTYPGLLKVVCSYGSKTEQALCIEGAIEKLADFNEQWALAACEFLDGSNKDVCLTATRGKMYRLYKPTMELYRTGISTTNTAIIEFLDAEMCETKPPALSE